MNAFKFKIVCCRHFKKILKSRPHRTVAIRLLTSSTSQDFNESDRILSHDLYEATNTDNNKQNNLKPPLIGIHGMFGFKSNLAKIIRDPKINESRDCFSVDLRNHGDSFHESSMKLTVLYFTFNIACIF